MAVGRRPAARECASREVEAVVELVVEVSAMTTHDGDGGPPMASSMPHATSDRILDRPQQGARAGWA